MAATIDLEQRMHASADARDAVAETLDAVRAVDDMLAGLAALRFELVDSARRLAFVADAPFGASSRDLTRRAFRAELACALLIPEATADRLASDAEMLVRDLPNTLMALREGRIRERHARILVDHLEGLEPDDRAAVERLAIPLAETMTAAKFERRVRALRERRAPHQQAERNRAARDRRDVVLHAEHDGMAWLGANLPAVEAVAIHSRIDSAARSLRRGGDPRALAQLRADLFCVALLDRGEGDARGTGGTGGQGGQGGQGGAGGAGGADGADGADLICYRAVRAQVVVTVPALTLIGRDDAPAVLEGYGPIDAVTARRLVADSPTLQRLLTHPHTGAELSLDRTRYRVTEELRTWLRVRDGGCRFPGCASAARACDVDHTHDWALDGPTSHDNLAHLCRSHHLLKHETAWRVRQPPDGGGDLHWTSPLGRRYITAPAFERIPAAPEWRPPPGEPPPG